MPIRTQMVSVASRELAPGFGRPLLAGAIAAGDEGHARGDLAMSERDAGVGARRDRRRDPGHYFERDPCSSERDRLFAAAREHERITALEAHHALARERELDELLVDLVLLRSSARRNACPRCGARLRGTRRAARGAASASCSTTSAPERARSPRTVMRPGSPGPAPISQTLPLMLGASLQCCMAHGSWGRRKPASSFDKPRVSRMDLTEGVTIGD